MLGLVSGASRSSKYKISCVTGSFVARDAELSRGEAARNGEFGVTRQQNC